MKQIIKELKIAFSQQHIHYDDVLEIGGTTKDGKYGKFILQGKNRVLLFRTRLGVGSCVDIETHDDGIEIAKMSRSIDTINEND